MALARERSGRFAEIVEKGRKVGITRIDLVPDALDAARVEPGCDQGSLARAWGSDHANGGLMGASFIERRKQTLARHGFMQPWTSELRELRLPGRHLPSRCMPPGKNRRSAGRLRANHSPLGA